MRRIRVFAAQPLFVVAWILAALSCLAIHATNAIAGKRLI